MAHILPSDIPNRILDAAHDGELATLALLKRRLPADYVIFHSVAWTSERPGGTAFGEIDFVVVNRSGAVLVIEQKNGALAEVGDRLIKPYRDGDKDVGAQVHRAIEGIRRKFGRQHNNAGLLIDYLIFCPDHRLKSVNAAGLDTSRVVDAKRASELPAIIEDLLGRGNEVSTADRVLRFFEQSFSLAPDVHAHVTSSERAMVRLADGLAATVGCIEMAPLKLRVCGVPGSGKSSVAARRFETAVANGKRPLLVCYNRPLAERMKARLRGQGGIVDTWYGLLVQFLSSQGKRPDFSEGISVDTWPKLQDQALVQAVPDDWLFDTIIVDEGQDFEPEWFELLRLFSRPDTDFLWLEDPEQRLRSIAPVDLMGQGFTGFHARANHRSPQSIARFLEKALPFGFEAANPLPGLGVGVTSYRQADEQGDHTAKVVANLIGMGFRHSDIVILSLKGLLSSTFNGATRVGPHTLSRFTGKYDLLGNQIASRGQILFESVQRFKGQQAPAVIVTDIDPPTGGLDQHQRLLLCAATRATARLELMANRNNQPNSVLFDA